MPDDDWYDEYRYLQNGIWEIIEEIKANYIDLGTAQKRLEKLVSY